MVLVNSSNDVPVLNSGGGSTLNVNSYGQAIGGAKVGVWCHTVFVTSVFCQMDFAAFPMDVHR